jgi:hypothetical protein
VRIAQQPVCVDRGWLWKSIVASLAMLLMFFTGWPVPKIAIVTGAALPFSRRVDPEKLYRNIEWGLLVMFRRPFHRDRRPGEDISRKRLSRPCRPTAPRRCIFVEQLLRPSVEPGE